MSKRKRKHNVLPFGPRAKVQTDLSFDEVLQSFPEGSPLRGIATAVHDFFGPHLVGGKDDNPLRHTPIYSLHTVGEPLEQQTGFFFKEDTHNSMALYAPYLTRELVETILAFKEWCADRDIEVMVTQTL